MPRDLSEWGDTLRGALALVKANHARLNGCDGPHDFSIDLNPDRKMGKKWRCTRCGGHIDAIRRRWYNTGLKHGRTLPE